MVSKFKDIQAGAFLLFVSVIMFTATLSFKKLTTSQVGPAFMPQIIAFLIAFMSIAIIIQGVKKAKASTEKVRLPMLMLEENEDGGVTYKSSNSVIYFDGCVCGRDAFCWFSDYYGSVYVSSNDDSFVIPERRWPLFLVVSVVSSGDHLLCIPKCLLYHATKRISIRGVGGMFDLLLSGFASILTIKGILLIMGGVTLGLIFGSIPGLTATMAIAICFRSHLV